MDFIKKHLDKILIGVGLLFGALAIIMLVAPGITPKADYKDFAESYTMSEITFGHKIDTPMGEYEVFKFAIVNLFTYVLIVAGMACAVVALLGKGGKIMNFVAENLLLVGGVLYFCACKLLVSTTPDQGVMTIGVGSILGGIFSILAAAAVVVPTFLKKAE